MFKKMSKLQKRTFLMCFIGIFCSLIILLPNVQRQIAKFMIEVVMNEVMTDEALHWWMNGLSLFGIPLFWCFVLGIIGIIIFLYLPIPITQRIREIFGLAKGSSLAILKETFGNRQAWKSIGWLFFALIVSYSAILRANINYLDDMWRAWYGYYGFVYQRYISGFLAFLVHSFIPFPTDISPLPQLFAALILAIGGYMLTVVLVGPGRQKWYAYIPSLLLGLSPYFLENFSFKFDAPYMALSISVLIFPFLFRKNNLAFLFTSILSTMVCAMTYQSSTGVYILIAATIVLFDWMDGKEFKQIFHFAINAIIGFCFALIFFKAVFVTPNNSGYVTTTMLSLSEIFPGILRNLKNYWTLIISDYQGSIFTFFVVMLCILVFVGALQKKKNHHRCSQLFFVILWLLFVCIFFVGVYLVLEKPLYRARGFTGFGCLLAVIAFTAIHLQNKKGLRTLAVLVAILLTYFCTTFALAYGNVLADQKQYTHFRESAIMQDISEHLPLDSGEYLLHVEGNIPYVAPTEQNTRRQLPLLVRLMSDDVGHGVWETFGLKYKGLQFDEERSNQTVFSKDELPLLVDTSLHTIYSDGEKILVVVK